MRPTKSRLRTGMEVLVGLAALVLILSGFGILSNPFHNRATAHSPAVARQAAAIPAAPPLPAQDSLNRIQQSLEKIEKLVPEVQKTLAEYRQLAQEARQTLPDIRRTNDTVQKFIKDVNEGVPDARRLTKSLADTMPDVQKLIKGVNEVVPEVKLLVKGTNEIVPEVKLLVKGINQIVPEAEKIAKGVNETIPVARDTLRDAGIASRNWGQVGERVFVMLGTNEKRINAIVEALDEATRGMVRAFSQENTNDLTAVLRNTRTASVRFPGIADESELLLRQSRSTMQKANETLKKVDETFDALNRGTTPRTPEEQGLLRNLSDSSVTLNRTLTDLNEVVRAISRSDGAVRRFIADPALYNHLDDAALMASRILPRLDRALKDFEVFADKLARHPESLGLGGVVRPSSGIKDPPRSSLYPRVP